MPRFPTPFLSYFEIVTAKSTASNLLSDSYIYTGGRLYRETSYNVGLCPLL